jgi:biopolymer transport protein ExbD
MSTIYKHGNAQIQGNLTPMIDMAFLLIVFFVLVSRIVDVQSAEMDLPRPHDALTEKPGDDRRLVINVLPELGRTTGKASTYRLGTADFPPDEFGFKAMTREIAAAFTANPAINVNVRADRSVHFEFVEPVLQAVSLAAHSAASTTGAKPGARVNLVVVQEN